MTLKILDAIKDKKEVFPFINRQVIARIVPGITENYSQIKGRHYNRSFVYRQVGRDDYPQPSYLEKMFDLWASVSFKSQSRGELLLTEIESWRGWRQELDEQPFFNAEATWWSLEEKIEALMSEVRKSHVQGDIHAERAAIAEIQGCISGMVQVSAAKSVNGNGRVLGK